MKRFILIGGAASLLLLSLLIGTFVMHNSLTSANGAAGKLSTIARMEEANSSSGNVGPNIKGKRHGATPTRVPKPTPTPKPTMPPTPTPVPTQVPVAPTPVPTQAPPAPVPTTSSGSGNGSGGTGTSEEIQLAQNLFAQINSDRAAQGLPAYAWNGTLANGAHQHSVTMGSTSCGLSHQCPGEPAIGQRITNEGISWMACGENAGYTSPYPDAWTAVKQNIEQGMLNEKAPNDGHRQNLLSSTFHRVGVGIYIDSKGVVWVTEDFTN